LKTILKIIHRGYGQLELQKVEALSDQVITEVACGCDHTCCVTSTGSIFTWGKYGTGHGNGEGIVSLPRLLRDLSSKDVISVSAHFHTACCVTKAGEVFTWGYGFYGKVGHGNYEARPDQQNPKRVEALVGVKAIQVSC
jgi:alpha-tubulin suppressor-like RCC1 family protein